MRHSLSQPSARAPRQQSRAVAVAPRIAYLEVLFFSCALAATAAALPLVMLLRG